MLEELKRQVYEANMENALRAGVKMIFDQIPTVESVNIYIGASDKMMDELLELSTRIPKDKITEYDKEELLNEATRELRNTIENCNAASLHVRRDDYLSTTYAYGFGGICTTAYYQNAIAYMKEKTIDPAFFVFSDDINWCRENLDVEGATFVDCNHGDESWQDMFLMSKCKHNIIANSSFSWWGAWLNNNTNKIVVAPDRWWNGLKDDVVPETWIRIGRKEGK